MSGVVHTKADEFEPWRNKTVFSTNKQQILASCGSRYSPTSPAEGFPLILSAPKAAVFIGKPCDIAAHYKAAKQNHALAAKTGCTIGIFCAGTPSTRATLDLIDNMGIKRELLAEFRYRGRGWLGMAAVRMKNDETFTNKMTYVESWGFFQKYRPLRCYQCPDGTSEFADISCGDPWHQKVEPREQGFSLVLARTRRGKAIIEQAIAAGYVQLKVTPSLSLINAQQNLFDKRSWIAGRLFIHKILGIPVPQFDGFDLGKLW